MGNQLNKVPDNQGYDFLSAEERLEIENARIERQDTLRVTVADLENILHQPFKVLDRGFVRVVDYMGGDDAIVQAARVSYGKGTRKTSSDTSLIRYLLRKRHTTPFEMCEIKFHIKLPIFVARQWIRHRTANVNEYSARYSKLDREFYLPDSKHLQAVLEQERGQEREKRKNMGDLFEAVEMEGRSEAHAAQSTSNKQGREDELARDEVRESLSKMRDISYRSHSVYRSLLNEKKHGKKDKDDRLGLARELARAVLPVNYYTQFYWKIDLHNLMHFLSLRADHHAQYEIRVYASLIMDKVVSRWVPITYEAFKDYVIDAVSLSAGSLDVVKRMLSGVEVEQETSNLSTREWKELRAVLGLDP